MSDYLRKQQNRRAAGVQQLLTPERETRKLEISFNQMIGKLKRDTKSIKVQDSRKNLTAKNSPLRESPIKLQKEPELNNSTLWPVSLKKRESSNDRRNATSN